MACRDSEMYKVTLKSWLWEQINSGKYRGLEWQDENYRIFKLPWVKETDPHWEEYYKLFHDWAAREGGQSHDSQKAKRNFRSVLNHSKHFLHMPQYDEERQTGSFKMYRFLTPEEIADQKNSKGRNFSEDSSGSSRTGASPDLLNYNRFNGYTEAPVTPLSAITYFASGLNNLNVQQDNAHPAERVPMNVVGSEYVPHISATAHADMNGPGATNDIHMASIPSIGSDHCVSMASDILRRAGVTPEELSTCTVTVQYNGMNVINERDASLEPPCKIVYGDQDHVRELENLNISRGTSPIPGTVIQLPEPQLPRLKEIVNNMNTGIVFWFNREKLTLNALRHCLAQPFYFDMGEKGGDPIKMERGEPCVLFSYERFLNVSGIDEIIPTASSNLASSKVEIVVGVQPKPGEYGRVAKGVKIVLQPRGAWKYGNCEDASMKDICLSLEESSLDKQLRRKKLSMLQPHQ